MLTPYEALDYMLKKGGEKWDPSRGYTQQDHTRDEMTNGWCRKIRTIVRGEAKRQKLEESTGESKSKKEKESGGESESNKEEESAGSL